jgi:integrase
VLTLFDVWLQFRSEREISLCPTSLVTDYAQAEKWLARCPVQDFTEGRQVLTWVLKQKPIKASRRVAMYVKSLYRWASSEDIGLIDRNPVASYRMAKPPQEDEDIIVIPRNEVSLVLVALESSTRKTNWANYSEFMLQTGMRTGEVRALKWDDIKNDKILVHSNYTLTHGLKNSTKTNKKRWVPLNARCNEILNETPQDSEFIFTGNRYAYQSYVYSRMKPLKQANLISHKYRPYDFRHTALSRWIEAGIPVAQVANWAGNSSEIIWKHYVNVTKEYEMPVL